MKIDRLKIAKALKAASNDQGNADDLAQELADAYDNAEKDMVSLEDLKAINARSDARHAEMLAKFRDATNRQIIWTVVIAFLVVGTIAAIVKL
ncbi:hypothetical protein [Aureimonas sp. AU20]|uniref:hypothetical protein n=1 Tax=Aureimonas sp. AU20 TaxID=1349819 RepID=UPI000B168DB8|nr:hypothetical protein [Aureimonas sp. AU20]